jgi:hypothetical protein
MEGLCGTIGDEHRHGYNKQTMPCRMDEYALCYSRLFIILDTIKAYYEHSRNPTRLPVVSMKR